MWDNRLTKRNPKQPDFKCRDRECDGVIWPPKPGAAPARPAVPSNAPQAFSGGPHIPGLDDDPPLPHEAIDKICAASQLFMAHVLNTELPAMKKAEIGASDTYVSSRIATMLITARELGALR